MIRYLLALLLLGSIGILSAQNKPLSLRKANKLYDLYSYVEAITYYEKAAKKEASASEAIPRLGDCYYNLHDYKNAAVWYEKAVKQAGVAPAYHLKYAEVLRTLGKYEEADFYTAKYHEQVATDTRGIRTANSKQFVEQMKQEGDNFEIENYRKLNSSQSDFGPAYFNKKLVITSNRGASPAVKRIHTWNGQPFLNVYMASDTAVKKLDGVNTRYHEGPACFNADGSVMFFTRNNFFNGKIQKDKQGTVNLKIFKAVLKNGKWENIESLPFNSDDYSVGHPSLSADGKLLYFTSDMPGGFGGADIYVADVNLDGSYGQPKNLGADINSEGEEVFPYIHKSNMLFYSSNGLLGFGGLDIFMSVVGKKGEYKKPVNIGLPANGTADDFTLILSDNQKEGYFASNREGGLGGDDIYKYKVLKPFIKEYHIKGFAREWKTEAIVPEAVIRLLDSTGKEIQRIVSGKDGSFDFVVDANKDYKMVGVKIGIGEGENKLTTKKLGTENTIVADLYLLPGFSMYGIVTDRDTKKPVDSVKVTLTDKINKSEKVIVVNSEGAFRELLPGLKLRDKIQYEIKLERRGYLTKTIDYTKELNVPGEILLHNEMELAIDKLVIGTDLGKVMNLNPIYFDVNKAIIRNDAMIELDKIVKVMQDNQNIVIELGSHTDCRSGAAYNLTLSDKRAKASAAYIISKGIAPNRIYGKGYGESQLVNDCGCEGAVKSKCTEEEHAKNRRTEFKVVKM